MAVSYIDCQSGYYSLFLPTWINPLILFYSVIKKEGKQKNYSKNSLICDIIQTNSASFKV